MNRRSALLLMGALLSTLPMGASAVTPLWPRLTDETRIGLLEGLRRAGLPEAAHNSVVIAITSVLGLEAADRSVDERSRYPQLPAMTGRAKRVSQTCSRVEISAGLSSEKDAVAVEGEYCLAGRARWTATRQTV